MLDPDSLPTMISAYVADREKVNMINEYDRAFKPASDDYARSRQMLESMAIDLTIQRTLNNLDYCFDNATQRRVFISQAISEKIERERDESFSAVPAVSFD